METYNDDNAIHTVDTNQVLTNTFFRMFLGLLASAGNRCCYNFFFII